ADAKISGEAGKIGDRAIGLAAGVEVRHESFRITPTANLLSGDIVGNGVATADASRTTEAAFAEINLPVTSSVDLTGAARVDKFPGFKAHASPKLAATWKATSTLLLRGTVESGFRAPNLTESAQSSKFAFSPSVADPKRCSKARALSNDLRGQSDTLPASDPNKALLAARADTVEGDECAVGVPSIVRNNPNLKPETTHMGTVGFVLEPVNGTSISLDYWKIERKDEIGNKSTDELLASEADQPAGVVNRAPLSADKTFTAAEQAQYGVTAGRLISTTGMFLNVARTKTSGFDLSANTRFNTGIGRLDLGANATYLLDLKNFSSALNGYGDNLAGRYGYSKTSANFTAALKTGDFSNSLRLIYQSKTALNDDYFDETYTLAGCAEKNWSADECRIKAYKRLDWNVSYTGIIKDLTLSLFVRNLTNNRPPLDLRAFNAEGGIIPQDTQDVSRRSVRVTAEYKFR
ncbi:MAG TPA: TonB-dependent receptor, partial [Duganella sp.]|uniref:TonB-dependent receptor domain-containing protein n=1 Tax=Duganella sp. TaxID=1904440 RepID=UPI002ED6AC98